MISIFSTSWQKRQLSPVWVHANKTPLYLLASNISRNPPMKVMRSKYLQSLLMSNSSIPSKKSRVLVVTLTQSNSNTKRQKHPLSRVSRMKNTRVLRLKREKMKEDNSSKCSINSKERVTKVIRRRSKKPQGLIAWQVVSNSVGDRKEELILLIRKRKVSRVRVNPCIRLVPQLASLLSSPMCPSINKYITRSLMKMLVTKK